MMTGPCFPYRDSMAGFHRDVNIDFVRQLQGSRCWELSNNCFICQDGCMVSGTGPCSLQGNTRGGVQG